MLNKRSFMLGAASTLAASRVLAATACGLADAARTGDGRPQFADSADLSTWRSYLSQGFELSDGAMNWSVTLDSIQTLEAGGGNTRTEQFLLGFVNQDSEPIPSGLLRLRHGNGQSTLLHLTDAGGGTRQGLRAEFNLLR